MNLARSGTRIIQYGNFQTNSMKKEKLSEADKLEIKKANRAFNELVSLGRRKEALISLEEFEPAAAAPEDLHFSPVPASTIENPQTSLF